MKSIVYIVPYFGTLPVNFNLWLLSCKCNPTIDWLLITDDKTTYNYPNNVHVIYDSFENIKKRIQENFDFEITLDRPWKLCEYKPAYGEIFKNEIKQYDFWGYCDIDLIWGNIRKFITDEMLDKYDKIGFQGHSTIYRNDDNVNVRYRFQKDGLLSYKEAFTHQRGYCFDEGPISKIYDALNIDYYKKTNFAHLCKYDYGFFLEHFPKEDDYKNKNQILTWEDGNIYRYYIVNNEIKIDEFMYIHFFCRPMTFKIKKYDEKIKYVFYPDVAEELSEDITLKYILKKSKRSLIRYYLKSFWFNRKKITLKRIINNIRWMCIYKTRKIRSIWFEKKEK